MNTNYNYWSQVLDSLKKVVSAADYQAWFSTLKFKEIIDQGHKVVLEVPSQFSRTYIQKKLITQLRESVNKYYPKVIHIDFVVDATPVEIREPVQTALELSPSDKQEAKQIEHRVSPKLSNYLPNKSLNNLNPRYSFDNLVTVKSNEFVVNVAHGVTKELGTLYNPLFIHSPVGLGKTHLLQAIGHKVLEDNPTLNIKYVPSETFFNQFYISLSKKEANKFRDYYHSVDLLLIDDVQFVGGKDGFQEVFFHIFNELHQNNKQIIITSDKPPKDLIGVEDRLISRFEWGMIADVPRPDFDDRRSILLDKIQRLQIILSPDQIDLIADKVDTNIRELEGVLNKVRAVVSLSNDKTLTDRDLARILGPYLDNRHHMEFKQEILNPDIINQIICKLFALQKNDLTGSSRRKDIALARQIGFWLYKEKLELSYPQIGRLFGNRDHSTVIHGVRKIKNRIEDKDTSVTGKLEMFDELLASKK